MARPENCVSRNWLARLWRHECERVYSDRYVRMFPLSLRAPSPCAPRASCLLDSKRKCSWRRQRRLSKGVTTSTVSVENMRYCTAEVRACVQNLLTF